MNRPSDPLVWRNFTRAELDAAYDNTKAVADSGPRRDGWIARSAALRARMPETLDLRYGPRERNCVDLFRCGVAGAPLLVFIHGGYWQRNSREMFACMAAGPMARGFDVATVGYTLAPDARLTGIVGEVASAIRWLRREGPSHGVGKGRLVVSGWSAGGHLTATTLAMPEVDAGLAISGVYDVEPCRLNNLNDKLRLDAEEARAMSPLLNLPPRSAPVTIAYGACELPELQRQALAYRDARLAAGLPATLLPLAPHHHFSVLDELESPDGRLVAASVELVAALK